MNQTIDEVPTVTASQFVERRGQARDGKTVAIERRQFADSHQGLSREGRELAQAIDQYKLAHRRRFITHDETLSILRSLGYHK